MKDDPIVEEVRAARDSFARENNYDLDRIFAALCEREDPKTRKYVSRDPRPAGAPLQDPPKPLGVGAFRSTRSDVSENAEDILREAATSRRDDLDR